MRWVLAMGPDANALELSDGLRHLLLFFGFFFSSVVSSSFDFYIFDLSFHRCIPH